MGVGWKVDCLNVKDTQFFTSFPTQNEERREKNRKGQEPRE